MDGVDYRAERRPSLKELLGLNGLGCCGGTWRFGATGISAREGEEENGGFGGSGVLRQPIEAAGNSLDIEPVPPCAGMNLAAALAAERQLRAALDRGGAVVVPTTPVGTPGRRLSLMRLIEETDGCDGERRREGERCDSVCCVCMGRKKDAAFIPCGHTFCRVCSRELWLNRGCCPLCNRPILEILDIY